MKTSLLPTNSLMLRLNFLRTAFFQLTKCRSKDGSVNQFFVYMNRLTSQQDSKRVIDSILTYHHGFRRVVSLGTYGFLHLVPSLGFPDFSQIFNIWLFYEKTFDKTDGV